MHAIGSGRLLGRGGSGELLRCPSGRAALHSMQWENPKVNYYNENDPFASAWLGKLIGAGHLWENPRMESIKQKVTHVLAAKQTRSHICHWPGCQASVPPAMWGCKRHWFMLPKSIRQKIWREYSSGQEERLDPSKAYILAAVEAREWVKKNYPSQRVMEESESDRSGE